MKIKAGVWIDHRQAVVVLITGSGEEIGPLGQHTDGVAKGLEGVGL